MPASRNGRQGSVCEAGGVQMLTPSSPPSPAIWSSDRAVSAPASAAMAAAAARSMSNTQATSASATSRSAARQVRWVTYS